MSDNQSQLKAIARTAGFWYLLMAISGIFGFLVIHPQVYASDPQQTLTNLVEGENNCPHPSAARNSDYCFTSTHRHLVLQVIQRHK
jgi:hypothetical protein